MTRAMVCYQRERGVTPSGETVLPPLLLVAYAQGRLTMERLMALLAGIGIEISKR